MSAALKPWLILAVIFIAGAFTGFAVTMVFSGPPGHPGDMQKRWMLNLTHQLNLTADQQAKIDPILRDTSEKVQKIHRDEFAQVRDILKASDDQIAAILTPDQKAELKKLVDEREKDFNGHERRWGGPRDGGPDGMHFHGGPGGPGDGYPPGPPPPDQALPPPPPDTNAPASAAPSTNAAPK